MAQKNIDLERLVAARESEKDAREARRRQDLQDRRNASAETPSRVQVVTDEDGAELHVRPLGLFGWLGQLDAWMAWIIPLCAVFPLMLLVGLAGALPLPLTLRVAVVAGVVLLFLAGVVVVALRRPVLRLRAGPNGLWAYWLHSRDPSAPDVAGAGDPRVTMQSFGPTHHKTGEREHRYGWHFLIFRGDDFGPQHQPGPAYHFNELDAETVQAFLRTHFQSR